MYWYVFNQHKLIISTCTVKLIGGKTILCQLVHAHVRTHTHTQLFSSSQVPTTKLHLEHLCKVFRVPSFLCFSTVICSVYALNRYYLINRYFIHITTMDLKKKKLGNSAWTKLYQEYSPQFSYKNICVHRSTQSIQWVRRAASLRVH